MTDDSADDEAITVLDQTVPVAEEGPPEEDPLEEDLALEGTDDLVQNAVSDDDKQRVFKRCLAGRGYRVLN